MDREQEEHLLLVAICLFPLNFRNREKREKERERKEKETKKRKENKTYTNVQHNNFEPNSEVEVLSQSLF